MRFTFSSRHRRRLVLRHADRTTSEIQLRRKCAILDERWDFGWIDGRSVRWRIPVEGETSGWEVAVGDAQPWKGEIHQHFWPWKSLGLVWTGSDQSRLLTRVSHLSKSVRKLEFEDGPVIGLWTGCGFTIEGVVRQRMAAELGPVVLLAAVGGMLN